MVNRRVYEEPPILTSSRVCKEVGERGMENQNGVGPAVRDGGKEWGEQRVGDAAPTTDLKRE